MSPGNCTVKLPDTFTRICKIPLKNTRISFGEITDVLHTDPFLKIYIADVLGEYLKKGGFLGMLTALGWEGFRNRLAEAYLCKVVEGQFPKVLELDFVNDVIAIEKRFRFLDKESSSRIFLLGFYLKLQDLTNQDDEHQMIIIPETVDEILSKGRSRSEFPDWLIFSVIQLHKKLGATELLKLLEQYQGNFELVLEELNVDQKFQYMQEMLNYGYAISDLEFLTATKV